MKYTVKARECEGCESPFRRPGLAGVGVMPSQIGLNVFSDETLCFSRAQSIFL